jgi:uncharacterized protein YgiB involved in biofilm formation
MITLAILGALAASGCAPSAEDTIAQDKSPATYANLTECTNDGNTTADCQKAFDESKKLTEEKAPKFASQAECAAQFGSCAPAPAQASAGGGSSDGGWFMPAMMGFMVGNMMADGSRAPAQPIYIDRDGRQQAASFAGGSYSARPAPQTYTAKASAARAAAASRASTSSRGGFGGRSSGSFGG